jgi:hypothetical protein
MAGERFLKGYDGPMGNDARAMLRDHIRADQSMPRALEFLRAKEMRDIGNALGGIDRRSLVDLRYHLADAFVQQVRTIRGNGLKPDRTARREALERLVQKAQALKEEAECNLPWLRDEHCAASFFGASGPDPSPFEYDYVYLVDAIARLEKIAAAILSVPPIGKGSTTSPHLEGFPSDRLENPGTWARVAFARRIGQIYHDLTGKLPGVTKEQDGPYQRMTAIASAAFWLAYRDAGQPFGTWRPPSRDDMEKARKNIGRKSA